MGKPCSSSWCDKDKPDPSHSGDLPSSPPWLDVSKASAEGAVEGAFMALASPSCTVAQVVACSFTVAATKAVNAALNGGEHSA